MTKLKGWESLSLLIVLVLLLPLAAALVPTSTAWAVADNNTAGAAQRPGWSRPAQLPPSMTQQFLTVNPQQQYAGQPVTITTNVSNTGGATGSYTVVLMINGQQEATKLVYVGAMSAMPVNFTVTKDVPGTYTVTIGNQQSSFTILGSGGGSAGSPANAPLIAGIVVGIVLIASLVVLFVRRRGFA